MKRILFLLLFCGLFFESFAQQARITWSEELRKQPTVKGTDFSDWLTLSLDSLWTASWQKSKAVDSIYISFSLSSDGMIENLNVQTAYSAHIQSDINQLFQDLQFDAKSYKLKDSETLSCEIVTQSHRFLQGEVFYYLNQVDFPPQIGKEPYSSELSPEDCKQVFEISMNKIGSLFKLPEKLAAQRREGSFLINLLFNKQGELVLIEPMYASSFKSLNDFAFLQTAQISASTGAIVKKDSVYMYYTFEFDLFYFDENLIDFDKNLISMFVEKGDYWSAFSKFKKLRQMNQTFDFELLSSLNSKFLKIGWYREANAVTEQLNKQIEQQNADLEAKIEVGEVKGYAIDEQNSKLPMFKECAQMPADVNKSQCSARVYGEYMEENLIIPKEFLKLGISANVLCKLHIDRSGNVTKVEVVKSESSLLNQAATDFFKGLPPIAPYMNNGKPIEKIYLMNLRYIAD